jgi:hypothetical protein
MHSLPAGSKRLNLKSKLYNLSTTLLQLTDASGKDHGSSLWELIKAGSFPGTF